LKEVGIQFCSQKSQWVRISGIWLRPYKSVGLELWTRITKWTQLLYYLEGKEISMNLRGSTKGRGPNPIKLKKGTTGSNKELHFKKLRKLF